MRLVPATTFVLVLTTPVMAATGGDLLIVLNKSDHEAALVDPATL